MLFQPVASRAAADDVARQIEHLVLEGVLHPGDRLPGERELSAQLGVSRPILREALKALEANGLIESRHGGGTYVAAIEGDIFAAPIVELIAASPKAAEDYLAFRREIEATAAAMAAARATEADRTILDRILLQMEEAHRAADLQREAALDVEFHKAIGEATHNIVMIHVLRACYRLLSEGVFRNRSRLYGKDGSRDALLAQHRSLLAAIATGDAAMARNAGIAHIDYVEAALKADAEAGARLEIATRRLIQFEERSAPRRAPRRTVKDDAKDAGGDADEGTSHSARKG
ncbi:GntR family transcriptional repressor for pyruvate dehydrogenase complex [Kaistia hirudinis]|uniref:Pyruvate dehydrogenase complex repressor n=1 Tax=Kaistia hirudinis TaxID=1293440 RepID=A0A840ANH3_9HYPH|nr:FadR/GntR family transcriptional regulator [Kaistia hirudinis]MBB3930431.1 GntR family transcriptional repressor for pyruvate dehydrogenase complex [Kaistia hirudinis]